MSGAFVLGGILLKVTDAMTESRTFPANLLGPLLYEVGDWAIDKIDTLEQAFPLVVSTHKRSDAREKRAFELGRECSRMDGKPQAPLPRVRHLHGV